MEDLRAAKCNLLFIFRCAGPCVVLCLHLHSSHHISVVLVGEVKSRQDGLELVENLIVPRHVSGQNASAIRTE